MRANTRALISDPRFSVQDFGPKGKWGLLSFTSPREMLECVKRHARTTNERAWTSDPEWCGLGSQSIADLDASGIPLHALEDIRAASATLPHKRSRPGAITPSVVGGSWSVPAVLAGLPLAARSRSRTKLAPLTINLVCTWSSSVSASDLASTFARLGRAINDYTLAGGAVTLHTHYLGFLHRAPIDSIKGLIIKMRVPTNDLAQLALACSPMAFRAACGPLVTAVSDGPRDSVRVPTESDNPIPASIYLGGRTSTGDIGANLAAALKALEVR